MKCSKKRGKCGKKKNKQAAAVPIQDENQPFQISGEGSNSPTAEVPIVPDVQGENNPNATNRKTRGKAQVLCFTKGKGKGARLEVEFNDMGQPIRKNAAIFSSFLGITARELIPVTLEKWSDLTDEFIAQIWEHIMVYFYKYQI